jgi:hypothetical protein
MPHTDKGLGGKMKTSVEIKTILCKLQAEGKLPSELWQLDPSIFAKFDTFPDEIVKTKKDLDDAYDALEACQATVQEYQKEYDTTEDTAT